MTHLLTPDEAQALERVRLRWLAEAGERLLRRTLERGATEGQDDD